MSSSERSLRTGLRAVALVLALAAAACTVRPLYSDAPIGPGGETTTAALASVSVAPVTTRYAQEVRNQLIFLLYGGSGAPAAPAYDLTLGVTERRDTTTTSQTTDENEPSSASMTVISRYVLVDRATRKPIAQGTRQASASFDVPRQEFAAYRAARDAENRAARELAEMLRLAIAQDLVRHGAK
ncbi:MAG: hypothetical protein J0H34_02090 [Rhizobiales bacterium]|nr:hypothetical protein [Hyphomicrobiales bacterium]